MIDSLIHLDKQWLLWINGHNTPFLDSLMYFVSGKLEWIPLYAVLLFFIIRKYRLKSLWILLAVVVLITLSDQVANLLKNNVKRYRPCKDPEIGHLVHLVHNYCRSSYGFVSGHAANSFALAVFISRLFKFKWVTAGMLIWAAIVSFSRIYLGVHFPIDVICGAMIGAILAWGVTTALFRIKYLRYTI
ncbi:MAG TPA: phosphatase PAP2 family protein [Bacteroidales bacterium]|nr:phosphatase PAP2 family protein [Bacteroidales bacterium]